AEGEEEARRVERAETRIGPCQASAAATPAPCHGPIRGDSSFIVRPPSAAIVSFRTMTPPDIVAAERGKRPTISSGFQPAWNAAARKTTTSEPVTPTIA